MARRTPLVRLRRASALLAGACLVAGCAGSSSPAEQASPSPELSPSPAFTPSPLPGAERYAVCRDRYDPIYRLMIDWREPWDGAVEVHESDRPDSEKAEALRRFAARFGRIQGELRELRSHPLLRRGKEQLARSLADSRRGWLAYADAWDGVRREEDLEALTTGRHAYRLALNQLRGDPCAPLLG